jgi:hypothetical protein
MSILTRVRDLIGRGIHPDNPGEQKNSFKCLGCGRRVAQWEVSRSKVGLVKNMCERCAFLTAYVNVWVSHLSEWVPGAGFWRTDRQARHREHPDFLHLDTGEGYPRLDAYVDLISDKWTLDQLTPSGRVKEHAQGQGAEAFEEHLILIREKWGGKQRKAYGFGLVALKTLKVISREKRSRKPQ